MEVLLAVVVVVLIVGVGLGAYHVGLRHRERPTAPPELLPHILSNSVDDGHKHNYSTVYAGGWICERCGYVTNKPKG